MGYLTCPMPECTEDLFLAWSLSIGIYDAADEPLVDNVPTPDGAHTGEWKVECLAGHVVLVPGQPGCDCDDEGGENCPHIDERDWSDELRTFRRHDAERLAAVIATLRPNAAPVKLPNGLCGMRSDHKPHDVYGAPIGDYHCSADQSTRLPYAAERLRAAVHGG